ncbi:MAG TPA: efflux RND transporter periplasmic adaptor subunit [Acetobacteraceae bacterium]|nr:efflux RND transporter periplasmic adaptor subunit [Acetobacteraceae bacterium]
MNRRGMKAALRNGAIGLCVVAATVVAVRASRAQRTLTAQSDSAVTSLVPVVTAKATRQDVPIYATGIGTVQAYQSVLVRARVDGTLTQFPVREGQEVKQGDLIAVIDSRPYQAVLDQATAKKAQDEALLVNARLDLTRFQSLAKQDFASRQQVDTQQALVNQFVATIAGDGAAIEAAQLNVAYCYITSPVDGRVGLRQVDPGNLIHATDTTGIVTITQIHPISATFTLPQEELPRVQADMAGAAPVLAYASDDRTELGDGTLLTPDNTIDTTTGTIRLKATFPNKDGKLWPGQFINAHLQIGTAHDAVTIPPASIEHGPDGLFAYIVKPDATIAQAAVSIGYQNDQLAVVSSGLAGGENVVVDGQSRLQAGTRVAVTTAQQAG